MIAPISLRTAPRKSVSAPGGATKIEFYPTLEFSSRGPALNEVDRAATAALIGKFLAKRARGAFITEF